MTNIATYTPLPAAESLKHARHALELLDGAPVIDREPADAGACEDCDRQVAIRWRYGNVTICRRCLLHRHRAATAHTAGYDTSETATRLVGVGSNSRVAENVARAEAEP